jgi:predicted lipoprotein with Yx(FWY)xxD motif
LLPLTLVLAACAAATPSPAPAVTSAPAATAVPPTAASAAEAPATAAPAEASINVAEDAALGQILVDGAGMTIYMFTKDEPDKSNCSGKCLENWPPLLTQGSPTLGEGVDAAMVGAADMPDGTKIVTYNHMPLYYWIKDTKPGDTTGQGSNDVCSSVYRVWQVRSAKASAHSWSFADFLARKLIPCVPKLAALDD